MAAADRPDPTIAAQPVACVRGALEVLAAHGVDVMLATNDETTPTSAVPHAILGYNRRRFHSNDTGLAYGIVVTPSHNPPRDGGFKYNPPHGSPVARRLLVPTSAQQKAQLVALMPQKITATELAGERIESIRSHALGNGEPIGGIEVNTTSGWFAARPSGTENIYKIYAESFVGADHLQRILQEAQAIVDAAIAPAPAP